MSFQPCRSRCAGIWARAAAEPDAASNRRSRRVLRIPANRLSIRARLYGTRRFSSRRASVFGLGGGGGAGHPPSHRRAGTGERCCIVCLFQRQPAHTMTGRCREDIAMDEPEAAPVASPPLVQLTALEARVLGCLIEKAATTPEVYPLTLNAAHLACNQKTNRDTSTRTPNSEPSEILRTLEDKRLVRVVHGARAALRAHDRRSTESSPRVRVR